MLGKLIVLVLVVALVFWLLTRFRDSGRGGR
jgi:flagellar biogenesis protein FliO